MDRCMQCDIPGETSKEVLASGVHGLPVQLRVLHYRAGLHILLHAKQKSMSNQAKALYWPSHILLHAVPKSINIQLQSLCWPSHPVTCCAKVNQRSAAIIVLAFTSCHMLCQSQCTFHCNRYAGLHILSHAMPRSINVQLQSLCWPSQPVACCAKVKKHSSATIMLASQPVGCSAKSTGNHYHIIPDQCHSQVPNTLFDNDVMQYTHEKLQLVQNESEARSARAASPNN